MSRVEKAHSKFAILISPQVFAHAFIIALSARYTSGRNAERGTQGDSGFEV